MSQDARLDDELATQRRALVLGMTYSDTSKSVEKPLYNQLLSKEELVKMRVVPLIAEEHYIHFGITTTTSQQTMKDLGQRFLDQRIEFSIISDNGFRDYMRLYDPPKKVEYANIQINTPNQDDLLKRVSATLAEVRADDMLAYLVSQAYQLKASDIHLETGESDVRVRIRVDGVLHPIASITLDKYRQLMSVIAVAGNISTGSVEAQTGHINKTYTMANNEKVTVNLRIETVPTVYATDLVMRLFNFKPELLNLEKLGLESQEKEVIENILTHPSGLVLIVGPTGSGKTTTLYSMINKLNTPERKIITLEDPVEYFIKGITQIPVSSQTDKEGFGEKLRAVLRLDPDVIMVGEIRDLDTAKTALQASLTGHLVLSTFHAASAAAALSRMVDAIGNNPLFASSIRLVSAQRLVRRLDDATKVAYQPDEALRAKIAEVLNDLPSSVPKPDLATMKLYKAGTSEQNPFGFQGQLAIREQLLMNEAILQLLRRPAREVTTDMLEAAAKAGGMVTMLQKGILKALSGDTTIEEIYRVVG